ncbi:c-type cytochrome [Thiomicrospira microaerophila]|uniref:cytochrome-c peroxidase n=1 Tax=Thiomicrospira microaerophila TaxID=406020 RepID=UPI00200C7F83|nr:cytochrome c peroxidase [Thiomicrospira microaerophila]UQB41840.1 c-type cytochrome [Thiomicrospira microaerophila]
MLLKRGALIGVVSTCVVLLSGCIGGESNTPMSASATQNNNIDNPADGLSGVNERTAREDLGDMLFHDVNLSLNRTMSCATCHNPQHGFIDNRENLFNQSVSMGADGIKFGTRNTPTIAYAQFSPAFFKDEATGEYVGGQFHDGRAQHLTAQVNLNGGPILNPVEMMMPDRNAVVDRLLENPDYIERFKAEFGDNIFERQGGGGGGGNPAFSRIGQAIAAFEMTDEISPFDSKYDRSLTGDYMLTAQEQRGYQLVHANCMSCHDSSAITGADKQTFSNYRYYNLGVPVNQAVRDALGNQDKDPGLAGHPNVSDEAQLGKFKTPTLRNIAITGPYMHNGVFQNLETVIAFKDYRRVANNNERVLNPKTQANWAEPDYPQTIQYTDAEAMNDQAIADIVAFLKLLTDKRYESLLD